MPTPHRAGDIEAVAVTQRLVAMLRAHVETLRHGGCRLEEAVARMDACASRTASEVSVCTHARRRSETRRATAAAVVLAWSVVEAVNEFCPKCGLQILGPRNMKGRAMLHKKICPGGNRRGESWFPAVPLADVRQPAPMLRLVRGGTR